MSAKVRINPRYAHLSGFVDKVLARDYRSESVMRDVRNTVEKVTAGDGTLLVVKRFVKPDLFHRLVYTVSWSKARRSYKYALRLQRLGIETAEPVAYMETRENGIFHMGYYITVFLPYDPLTRMTEYELDERKRITADFARFTAGMHKKNISHRDYNPTNIFYRKEADGYHFSLVDINRMRFTKPSKRECVKELTRLDLDLPTRVAIVEQYAIVRGWDPHGLCAAVLVDGYLNPWRRIKKFLKPLKRLLRIGAK